jgi:hypothetical protein
MVSQIFYRRHSIFGRFSYISRQENTGSDMSTTRYVYDNSVHKCQPGAVCQACDVNREERFGFQPLHQNASKWKKLTQKEGEQTEDCIYDLIFVRIVNSKRNIVKVSTVKACANQSFTKRNFKKNN